MAAQKHFHIYRKADIGRREFNKSTKKWTKIPYIVYKCIECAHHTTPELILMRQAKCCRCGNPFVVTPKCLVSGRIVNIHCEDCFQDKEMVGAIDLVKELNLD